MTTEAREVLEALWQGCRVVEDIRLEFALLVNPDWTFHSIASLDTIALLVKQKMIERKFYDGCVLTDAGLKAIGKPTHPPKDSCSPPT